jgi:hypothetical protein
MLEVGKDRNEERYKVYLTKERRKKRRIELRKGMTEGGEKTKKLNNEER